MSPETDQEYLVFTATSSVYVIGLGVSFVLGCLLGHLRLRSVSQAFVVMLVCLLLLGVLVVVLQEGFRFKARLAIDLLGSFSLALVVHIFTLVRRGKKQKASGERSASSVEMRQP